MYNKYSNSDFHLLKSLKGAKMSKKIGFTLAEVLITLGIIGVVAAMTMPVLIQKQTEKATVVALKKFYTNLDQAVKLNLLENSDDYNVNNIVKKMKTVKICLNGSEDNSCAMHDYKKFNGTSTIEFGKTDHYYDGYTYAVLNDGMIERMGNISDDCSYVRGTSPALQNVCGEVSVDVNGNKGPNRDGYDVFYFHITKFGVVPFGGINDSVNPFNSNNSYAAWVIYNGNMDYLHCDDLSWNGKTKCK